MVSYKIYGLKLSYEDEIRYVGITKQKINQRLRQHKKDLRRNPHKRNWILKYKSKIEVVILQDGILSLSEANNREKHFIAFYRSAGFRLLNATDGGDGTAGFSSWNKGVQCNYKDKLITNSPKAQKILCYDLRGDFIKEYRSIKFAALCTGIPRQSIYGCLTGKNGQKYAGCYQFRYDSADPLKKIPAVVFDRKGNMVVCSDTGEKFSSISLAARRMGVSNSKIINALSDNQFKIEELQNKRDKPVTCIETGENFPSVSRASEKMNIHLGNICAVINGQRKRAGGYTFKIDE